MDFAIFGISAVLLVKLMVNIIKQYGLSTKLALPAAVVLGVLLSILNQVAILFPEFAFWYKTIWTGVVVGLVAAEVYDVGKSLTSISTGLKKLNEFAREQ